MNWFAFCVVLFGAPTLVFSIWGFVRLMETFPIIAIGLLLIAVATLAGLSIDR